VLIGATTKARASTEAVVACENVLQVLGGMGFTVEHALHHHFKRALSLAAHDGSAAELNLLVGRLVLASKENS
jgi:alkylation response protein AidB-like acyl-CoA dehydrogenase